jgi:hypothetical protein
MRIFKLKIPVNCSPDKTCKTVNRYAYNYVITKKDGLRKIFVVLFA